MTRTLTLDEPLNFDAWLKWRWNHHADQPQQVADRITEYLPQVGETSQVVPFARLATHVFGEHLGQWHRGIDLIERLRAIPAADPSAIAGAALERNIRTLRYAGGDVSALEDLERDDRIAVLAAVATALAGRQDFAGASAAYADALGSSNT